MARELPATSNDLHFKSGQNARQQAQPLCN